MKYWQQQLAKAITTLWSNDIVLKRISSLDIVLISFSSKFCPRSLYFSWTRKFQTLESFLGALYSHSLLDSSAVLLFHESWMHSFSLFFDNSLHLGFFFFPHPLEVRFLLPLLASCSSLPVSSSLAFLSSCKEIEETILFSLLFIWNFFLVNLFCPAFKWEDWITRSIREYNK